MNERIKQLESSYSRKYSQRDIMNNWFSAESKNGGKAPRMKFSARAGMPHAEVKTNDPADQEFQYGTIDFTTDSATFFSYVNILARYGKGEFEPGTVHSFQYKSRFVGPKTYPEPVVMSTLVVGRHKDGRVFHSIFSSNTKRPRIAFYFGPNRMYHAMLLNGEEDVRAESEAYAAGWATLLMHMILDGIFNEFDPSSKALAMGEEDRKIRDQVHDERKKERGRTFSKRQGGGSSAPSSQRSSSESSSQGNKDSTFNDFGDDDDFANF